MQRKEFALRIVKCSHDCLSPARKVLSRTFILIFNDPRKLLAPSQIDRCQNQFGHFIENGLMARNEVFLIGGSDSMKFLFRESKKKKSFGATLRLDARCGYLWAFVAFKNSLDDQALWTCEFLRSIK
jgi:hypothetical protein